MGKRKTNPPPPPPQEPAFERIEIQVPIGFTKRIDAYAEKKGRMSRSAYIRNAILRQFREDDREEGGK
jgi:metal-responsive CopG/Arc/MetJ family transcriptional regulator